MHLKLHILLEMITGCTECSFAIMSCAASAEQPHLFACRTYILNMSLLYTTSKIILLCRPVQSAPFFLGIYCEYTAGTKLCLSETVPLQGFPGSSRSCRGSLQYHLQPSGQPSCADACCCFLFAAVSCRARLAKPAEGLLLLCNAVWYHGEHHRVHHHSIQVMPVNSAAVIIAQQLVDHNPS